MYHCEGGYKEEHLKCLSDTIEASKYKRKKANENEAKDSMVGLIRDVKHKNIVKHNSILDFFET